MIRYTSQNQLTFDGFKTPFDHNLNKKNRWVVLAALLPWDKLAGEYAKKLNPSLVAITLQTVPPISLHTVPVISLQTVPLSIMNNIVLALLKKQYQHGRKQKKHYGYQTSITTQTKRI